MTFGTLFFMLDPGINPSSLKKSIVCSGYLYGLSPNALIFILLIMMMFSTYFFYPHD